MEPFKGYAYKRSPDSIRIEYRARCGGHWFDADTMRFFRSRIGRGYRNADHRGSGMVYFVTSEQNGRSGVRRYSVRVLSDDGIDTIGRFQRFASRKTAHAFAERLAARDARPWNCAVCCAVNADDGQGDGSCDCCGAPANEANRTGECLTLETASANANPH